MARLLEIENLIVGFETSKSYTKSSEAQNAAGFMRAVDGVSLHINQGETVGLVGESGCGKSATAFSILQLLPFPTGKIVSGNIIFNDAGKNIELTKMGEKELCEIRGKSISMIFQEPMSALNPVMRIGDQVAEGLLIHEKISKKEALKEAERLLNRVGIENAAARMKSYPHQLSGGQRQRAVIAMSLICKPQLIIADEPTTALDVTLQNQILELLKELQRETGAAILFITHDLGLVKKFCERTYVMYAGQIVEHGNSRDIFSQPQYPYTRALLNSRPNDALKPKTLMTTIEGRLPTFWEWQSGCRFAARCVYAKAECKAQQILEETQTTTVRCCRYKEIKGETKP
jgi:oligopeptide/dipeptide ABC transporter ATP-binding protein